jgi:DNA-directed RNA polymerase subunit RPC12/RpoP
MEATITHYRCGDCGSEQLIQPQDPHPDDIITCAHCGATWTVREVQEASLEAGTLAAIDKIDETFGKE